MRDCKSEIRSWLLRNISGGSLGREFVCLPLCSLTILPSMENLDVNKTSQEDSGL